MGKVIPDNILPEYRRIFSLTTNIPEEDCKDLTIEEMDKILDDLEQFIV